MRNGKLWLACSFLMQVIHPLAAFSQSEIPATVGPSVVSELFVGYGEDKLIDAFGDPSMINNNVKRKSSTYLWTRIELTDGSVFFDDRGWPENFEPTDSDRVIQCRREFDIHPSGLVMRARHNGGCAESNFPLGGRAANQFTRLKASRASVRYDGPDALNRLALDLSYYFGTDEVAGFHQYFDQLSRGEPDLLNGRSPLEGIVSHFRDTYIAHNQWVRYHDRIKTWRSQLPESAGVAILEAMYWESYAWYARGAGVSSSVSKKGFKLFHERIKKALAILDQTKNISASNPLWYELRLSLMLYDGADKAEIEAKANEAIALFPGYWPLRSSMLHALAPFWGGSYEQMDAYINRQLMHEWKEGQTALYTRLYWAMQQYTRPPATVFSISKAEWQRVAKGFERLVEIYPISFWIKQNFAAFACIANDAEVYRKLRPEIEGFIHPAAWRPPYNLETCDYNLLTGA